MFKNCIKGTIVGVISISLAFLITACSETQNIEAQQDNELKTREDVRHDGGGVFQSFIITDKKTGMEYIVVKNGSGISITPRLQLEKENR